MGTTAEKLSYLNETKTKIKNALETPSNIFRDYPSLIKKYIDNQPTKIATNGICDNAVELPIVSLGADGNSEQKTTEGYNLLQNIDHKDDKSYTVNGVTFTKNSDGSIVANGNATETARYYLVGEGSQQRVEIKIGTYRVTGCPSGGSLSTYSMAWGITGLGEKYDLGDGINITLSSDTTYYFVVKIGKGQTVNNLVFKPMIISGTAEKSYEPYTGGTPSPNPEYLQEIEAIDNGWNRFDKNAVIKREYITDNGSVGKIDILSRTSKIKVQSGKNYTISGLVAISGYAWNVSFWNENTFINRRTSLATVLTFSIPENCNYIILSVWNRDLSNVQLTESTTQKPYLPYGYIGLEQSGKNKVDFINYVEKVFDSSKVEKLDDGSYKFKHADGSYSLYEGLLKPPCTLSFWAKNDTGESVSSYTFSFKIFYEDGTYDRVSMITNGNFARKEFKIKNVIKIANTYISTKPFTIIKDVQLEEGSTATSYEPHHETKVIPIDLQGNTLAKVGDIKDKLIIHRNGEVELEKKVRKYVFTGEELWNQSSYGEKSWILPVSYVSAEKTNSTMNVISNIFNGVSSDDRSKELKNKIYTDNSSGAIVIRDTQLTTLEDVRVATKDNYIYYKLITPQTIKLPSINPIELWQGTNIFKLITNLETNFEVEYVVDKDSMLDEVQTAMLNAEIEI